ncbi:putative quorum-quenching lactonase YtnP [Streptomyces sp. YIM 130001]|uniref:MBL fold metallo-hydrolase n=1 Tax=Streptomyces sp. YIM 130001 TaxID=2259644 RepID=UPI000E64782C|nr:MBL fold metallo-hydrolase [Streptomyces sp. YIM 130001]RII19744.1 putative quorum-quenching lactonase YtnP [Streptomyces sp. YIM 130001]
MLNSTVDQGERLRRTARPRSLQLGGGTRVSYLPDGDVRLPPRGWLPESTDEVWTEHSEYLDDTGHLVASIGALLVEHGGRALLIDAGFGAESLPPDAATPRGTIQGGLLLDSLAQLGRAPRDIEAVAITHLHPDHIGWAWRPAPGTDRPAFAHADYLVSEPEWAGRDELAAKHGLTEEIAGVAPYVRTVADGQEIFPGVRMRVTAGHTAGHAEYVVTGGERRLIAFGDALHSPIQIDHPEWSASPDHDPAGSAEHRRRLVAELAEPRTIGFGVHFADVVFGQVRPDGAGPAWQPVDA